MSLSFKISHCGIYVIPFSITDVNQRKILHSKKPDSRTFLGQTEHEALCTKQYNCVTSLCHRGIALLASLDEGLLGTCISNKGIEILRVLLF